MHSWIRIGTHDMGPQGLGDSHGADKEVLNFYWSAAGLLPK